MRSVGKPWLDTKWVRRTAALLALGLVACTSGFSGNPKPVASQSLPSAPRVLDPLVARHARQFDEDIPLRPAGSQEELAAAGYISGHLQLAGYAIRLDSVPVADQVKSSNVVALPPSGGDPRIVVTVVYDSDGQTLTGSSIGLFLELARALKIEMPDHRVEFVAEGATATNREGGAIVLREELSRSEELPSVVAIGPTRPSSPIILFGSDKIAGSIRAELDERGSSYRLVGPPDSVDQEVPTASVQGDASMLGPSLLAYLLKFGG